MLESWGWSVVDCDATRPLQTYSRHAVAEYATVSGPADYALVVDGQLLGLVEAKRLTVGPHGALTQAERYSRGASAGSFNFHGYHVPFLYSTNGEFIYFQDVRDPHNLSRQVAEFHTPGALRELLGTDLSVA